MKSYNVTKYTYKANGTIKTTEYGTLPEVDVKRMLKNYKYDEFANMWFSPAANRAYSITEE